MPSQRASNESADCMVIGGGPAGLTAAIYLARFHLSVTVFDDGSSRAATIPVTHNHAGFPEGISGRDLLARMRTQAISYGAAVRHDTVSSLAKDDSGFIAQFADGHVRARTVLLATGVVNHRPPEAQSCHDEAVARGLLRYCPVCDGFEVTDKAVGIIGSGTKAYQEALFLRSYTRDVTLISPLEAHELSDDELSELKALGIGIEEGPITSIDLDADSIRVTVPDRQCIFASVYPALGSKVRSGLTLSLGASLTEDGCVVVDEHQRTSVAGLYAAGDVVAGLDQISHAMGQVGVAATAIRNDLCEKERLVR